MSKYKHRYYKSQVAFWEATREINGIINKQPQEHGPYAPEEIIEIFNTITGLDVSLRIKGGSKVWWVKLLVKECSLFVDLIDNRIALVKMVGSGEQVAAYSLNDPDCFQKMRETLDAEVPYYKRAIR